MIVQQDPFRLAGLRQCGSDSPFSALASITAPDFIQRFNHGDLPRWLNAIDNLPDLHADQVDLASAVRLTGEGVTDQDRATLEKALKQFVPWRKGPYELFGVEVDAEWRSNLKWDRLANEISSLEGRSVLDVGCGSGYHCWRALGAGARVVVGVEPYLLYVMQFLTVKRYLPERPCYVLPVSLERLPGPKAYFDTILSMGVIYHVRSPFDHLLKLRKCLAPGGELVLETLVVEGDKGYSLTPPQRYARMGNIWFIPSVPTLVAWLERCGYEQIKVVDVSVTGEQEQRRTEWMPFESLIDGLDTGDSSLTTEGYPAPTRAILTARPGG